MNPTEYVKVPQLKTIIDAEQPCESKLESIKNLIDGSSGSGSTVPTASGPLSYVAPGGTADKHEKVLAEISGANEKKLGLALLQEIEKSSLLTWNPESLEIALNGETIKFSKISLLIKKVITTAGATLPVGLTLFIESLLKQKIPYTYYRSGDAINIRDNLVTILDGKTSGASIAEETLPADNSVEPGDKRKREGESDEENDESKRAKPVVNEEQIEKETEETKNKNEKPRKIRKAKRDFKVEPNKLKNLRRSPRLLQDISAAWESNRNGNKS